MPGYKKPMMGHKPKMYGKKPMMAHGKKPMMAKKGLAALAAKVPELTYTPKMMKVMGNKGTKNSPLNFKDLDVANAKAMDYNQGKPMMYHGDKPKMASDDDKKKSKFKKDVEQGTNLVKNPFYGDKKYQGFSLDKNTRESQEIPRSVVENIYKRVHDRNRRQGKG